MKEQLLNKVENIVTKSEIANYQQFPEASVCTKGLSRITDCLSSGFLPELIVSHDAGALKCLHDDPEGFIIIF